jgi:hypothetical protein
LELEMLDPDEWKKFCEEASAVMRDALENKISLEEASAFFERQKVISDASVQRYVESIIWEIDGSRKYYLEVLDLFEKGVSEQQLIERLKS